MAMVIVLSVFNGFDEIIQKIYYNVDSDFKIELKEGFVFDTSDLLMEKIKNIDGVTAYSEVLEHKMLLEAKGQDLAVVHAKGVSANYLDVNNIKNSISRGYYFDDKKHHVIVGSHIANLLSVNVLDYDEPLQLSFFRDNPSGLALDKINQVKKSFYVSGVFQTFSEFDNTHILLNINDLRDFLFLNMNSCSSIEIKLSDLRYEKEVEAELKRIIGTSFIVKNRSDQRPFIYKMVETEKLAVYIIFSFILIISLLSLIASLVVLLMEKQNDIYTMYSFGIHKDKIKNIFFLVGVFITMLGSIAGTALGRFFCYLQDKFEIVQLGQSSPFLQAYPVRVELIDIIMIQLIVLFLGSMTSYLVSRTQNFYHY
tara:strand:- start:413 stop:1516 length:1104 start_codon:yes stop_codon:yes gene_type:complete